MSPIAIECTNKTAIIINNESLIVTFHTLQIIHIEIIAMKNLNMRKIKMSALGIKRKHAKDKTNSIKPKELMLSQFEKLIVFLNKNRE